MLALINRILDWFKSIFWKEEMELTLVGLQFSGKTTFVNVIAVSSIFANNEYVGGGCSVRGAECAAGNDKCIRKRKKIRKLILNTLAKRGPGKAVTNRALLLFNIDLPLFRSHTLIVVLLFYIICCSCC